MIWGYAEEPDGGKIPFAEIEIQDATGKALTTVIADASGRYEYFASIPGNYLVVPVQTASGSPSKKFPVYVNEDRQVNVVFSGTSSISPSPSSAPTGNLKGAVEDIASYPILTEEIGYPAAPRSSAPGTPGAAPLGANRRRRTA